MKRIPVEKHLIETEKDRGIEAAIRNFSRQYILSAVANNGSAAFDANTRWGYRSFNGINTILEQIGTLSGEGGFQGSYTKAICRGVQLFAEELIKYMREQNAAGLPRYGSLPYGRQRSEHPANVLAEVLISSSPSLFSALDPVQKIEIAAAFERVPNLDTHYRSNIFDELVLSLAYAEGDSISSIFEEIEERFKTAPVAEQIAIGRTFYSLGLSALNAGYESGEESARYYSEFLWHLSESTDSTFVELMMGNLARKIDYEYDKVMNGEIKDLEYLPFLKFARQTHAAREKAARNYGISSKDRGMRESTQVVSSDYIGLYSEGGNLIELAPREKNPKFSDTQKIFNTPENIPFGSSQNTEDVRYIYEQTQSWLCRASIENTLGVDLGKLPLRSQVQLITYLVNCKEDEFKKLFGLAQADQVTVDFYQAFFAQNADGQASHMLIESVHKNGIEAVSHICKKYNELITEITKIESMIAEFFTHKTDRPVDARKVVQEFTKRTAHLLYQACSEPHKAHEYFASVSKDVLTFSSIFKTAIKSGVEFKLEDVVSLDVASFSGKELPDEIRLSLKEIAAANWLVRGEIGRNVVAGFNNVVDQGGSERVWHVLRRGNEVISFVRFDGIKKMDDGKPHEYAGSFNVHPAYRGSAIGEAMMNEILIEESKRAVLHATMDPRIDVGTRYVEDIGFMVTGVAENYLETSESFFEITANQAVLGNFESRGWTREQALTFARERVRESLAAQAERGDIIVASVTRDAGAEPEFITDAAQILRAGFVGTRYLSEGDGSKVRYMIFEKSK